jgi:hypothetical protein
MAVPADVSCWASVTSEARMPRPLYEVLRELPVPGAVEA